MKYMLDDIQKAKDAFPTGANLDFKELLAKEHAPVAQEVRELTDWILNAFNSDPNFFKSFVDALGMAAVTNKELEEQMEMLFAGIMTVVQDYNEHQKDNYDVKVMQKRYNEHKMKDFKKWPGGESQLYPSLIGFLRDFSVSEYYKLVLSPIKEDLERFLSFVNLIPVEEQTGDKGRKSHLWKLIPWFKKVMEYLNMNEDTVRESLIAARKGKEFDIKEHTYHLEGFASTTFDRRVAADFACHKDSATGKKPVIIEFNIK